jgi:hypothetical protein
MAILVTEIPTSCTAPKGLWFVYEEVFSGSDNVGYSSYFSLEPIRAGDKYEFLVLPHSRVILDFRHL